MITLRFNLAHISSPFPIAIRFVRVDVEATPPWPIVSPNLWIALGLRLSTSALGIEMPLRSCRPFQQQRVGMLGALEQVVSQCSMPMLRWLLQSQSRFETKAPAMAWHNNVGGWVVAVVSTGHVVRWQKAELAHTVHQFASGRYVIGRSTRANYQYVPAMTYRQLSPWQQSKPHVSLHWRYGPRPAQWRCELLQTNLNGQARMRFDAKPSSTRLVFEPPAKVCRWDEGGGYKHAHDVLPVIDFVIPIEPTWLRSYLMQPSILCERLSDGQTIAISQISISQRRGNFAKAVNVTFQSHIDMQRARNESLKVVINGYEHRVLIEQFSTSRRFGDASFQGQGRSLLALLASPYQLPITYANSTPRSLLGILSDLLNGSGWTVKLQGFSDFTIPEGAFSVQGKAPIEAIAAQLDGIGVMLHANDIRKELTLLPKWPIVPWQMANQSPAIVFHQGVIQSLSESEELSPLCNGIYVRGEQVGVSAHVKRQGTAGNVTPNDISHPLVVTAVAAQLCGTAALADTGKKRQWQITAPVMATLPIVTEGQLIGIRDELGFLHIAMVDSWSVSASISADGAVSVKQSFTVLEPLEV